MAKMPEGTISLGYVNGWEYAVVGDRVYRWPLDNPGIGSGDDAPIAMTADFREYAHRYPSLVEALDFSRLPD